MQAVLKRFSGPGFLDTAGAALYTAPTGKTSSVKLLILHNAGASDATYTIHLNGISSSNRIAHETLKPDKTRIIPFGGSGLPLHQGDAIWGRSSVADSIVATVCGAEVS